MGRNAIYSDEFKAQIIKRMLPPNNESVRKLSSELGICNQTLHKWKRWAIQNGGQPVSPGSQTGQEKLAQTRFQIVIEASSLNEAELTAYAQKKGLQVGEIKKWIVAAKASMVTDLSSHNNLKNERDEIYRKYIDSEKDNRRLKDALAEASALILLGKKADAILNRKKED